MNKNLVIKSVAFVALALGAGFVGGILDQNFGAKPALAAGTTQQTQPSTAAGQQSVHTPEIAGATYRGLNPVDPKWVQKFLGTKVHNSAGHSVSMPTSKPILVVAPWCHYCHDLMQLLGQHALLDKVQVVGVGFNYSETDKNTSTNVTTVSQAEDMMQKSFAQNNVKLDNNNMLYAMPSDGLDGQLSGFPLLLVQHDGKWYMQVGFYPTVDHWQTVLS